MNPPCDREQLGPAAQEMQHDLMRLAAALERAGEDAKAYRAAWQARQPNPIEPTTTTLKD